MAIDTDAPFTQFVTGPGLTVGGEFQRRLDLIDFSAIDANELLPGNQEFSLFTGSEFTDAGLLLVVYSDELR